VLPLEGGGKSIFDYLTDQTDNGNALPIGNASKPRG
jgi:hypothetical protein